MTKWFAHNKYNGRVMQVSLPVATVDGCPVGLGVIGPRGSDEQLLRLTEKLVPLLVPSDTSS